MFKHPSALDFRVTKETSLSFCDFNNSFYNILGKF